MNLKETILKTELCGNQLAIFYTGQVGFIIKFHDKYILIDGYLSDYVDKNCSTIVKWVRNYPSPISGSELDFIDYVFCTHEHYDHTDPYTVKEIAECNKKAKFIASLAFCNVLTSYGVAKEQIMGVEADKSYHVDDFSFTPIPSAHEKLNLDENGFYKELGFKLYLGDTVVYHSGDCCMYDGLAERINDADVLMLPINGRDYFRNNEDIIGCFDSNEAIRLAKIINAALLIPTHFDLYSVNEVNPAYFVDCLGKINRHQHYHIFAPGERYIFAK